MNRKTILQTAALIVAGIVLALVANAFASRDRKMALVGTYPNALKVPPREVTSTQPVIASPPTATEAVVTPPAPASTTTTAQQTATAAIETVGLNPAAKNPATNTASASTAGVQPVTNAAVKNPVSTPTPHIPSATATTEFNPHPDKPYVEIGFAGVNWLHAKGVLFLDARRTSVYEQGHISGARTYSVWESDIDEKVNKLFEERGDPQSQVLPIVIYCSGGECEDSHMLAQKLWGIQFNNVYVYKDGFPDWQHRAGTIHTGAKP